MIDGPIEENVAAVIRQGAYRSLLGDYRSSMLLDVLNERPPEIEHTAGYIVRKARELGIAVPYLEFA